MKKLTHILLFLAVSATVFSSCKKAFDAPPADGQDPDITATNTIADLKALHLVGDPYQLITDDMIIEAVVIADDKSGNFYKTIVVQDASAGISIRIEQADLYTQYPVGRKLFINCKGLYIGDYNGLYQLGGALDMTDPANPALLGISSVLLDKFLVKGSYNNVVTPLLRTMGTLSNDDQNMLIQIDGVEFSDADLGTTYADAVNKFSMNKTVHDCSGISAIIRNSGYADFAAQPIPEGNGTLTAVMSIYGSTLQLLIRDTSDCPFHAARCSGTTGPVLTCAQIHSMFNLGTLTVPTGKSVSGIVISDGGNANFNSKALYIQDSTGGIELFFASPHTFNLGDKVSVDISGLTLDNTYGPLEVSGVPNANCTVVGSGTPTVRTATLAQVNSNLAAWESTLIKVVSVSLSGAGTTYSGSLTMDDGTGTTTLYTRSGATFSGDIFPTGTLSSVTGVLTTFSGSSEMLLRNAGDVVP